MTTPAEERAASELFSPLSDAEFREACVEALRRTHREHPDLIYLGVNDHFGRNLLVVAAERTGSGISDGLKETFLGSDLSSPPFQWKRTYREALDSLVRAGIIIPRGALQSQHPHAYDLTKAGARFLESTELHPLLPRYVERVRERCPGIPQGVLALLTDAKACIDNALYRPAVAVMGLALETVAEAITDALVQAGTLTAPVEGAAARLAAIRGVVAARLPGNAPADRDLRDRVNEALDYASALRNRRNDASHTTPRYDFADREEIEELLVSAGRHIPNLWRMTTG